MSFLFNDLFGGGMPGGHSFHSHHMHEEEEDNEPVDTEAFYKILGVEKTATQDEIKKAYRKKAKTLHPDRHPDEHEKYQALFQEVQKAFEVLKDPAKRSRYDKYGEEGAKRGGGGGSHHDILSQMFGGGSRREEHHGPKKSPKIQSTLSCTLEDIYCGAKKKIKITRRVAGADSAKCSRCHGQGSITQTQRMGPMVLQQRRECPSCGGIGYQLNREEHEIEVHVPIGGRDRETVTISGEGNIYPDHEPGDVLLQIRLAKHEVFKRQGADLGMNYSLSLKQALCGYKIKIEHVSGRTLVITPQDKNEIVQPGSLKIVHTMGLPQRFSPHVKGHLYIVMDVVMPISGSLKPKTLKQFQSILPKQNVQQTWTDDKDKDDKTDEDGDDEMKSNNKQQQQPQKKQQQTHPKQQQQQHSNKKNKQQNRKNKNQHKNKKNKNKNKNKNKKNKNKGVFGGLHGFYGDNAGGKGAGGGGNKQQNKQNEAMDQDEEEYDDELIEEVECHHVDGNPKATPATASNYYQEDDDDGENVQCRQM